MMSTSSFMSTLAALVLLFCSLVFIRLFSLLLVDKREQVSVDLFLFGCAESVWRAFVDLQLCVLYQLRLELPCIVEWNDLIVVSLNYERWHINPFQVFVLIGFGKRFDAEVSSRKSAQHSLKPKRFLHALRNFDARAIVTVKRNCEVFEESRAIADNAAANIVEYFSWQPAWILVRFQHERWHC